MYLRDGSAEAILRAATLEIEIADQTFYLTQSQYTDTGPTSASTDPYLYELQQMTAKKQMTGYIEMTASDLDTLRNASPYHSSRTIIPMIIKMMLTMMMMMKHN